MIPRASNTSVLMERQSKLRDLVTSHHQPDLSAQEREAIAKAVAHYAGKRHAKVPQAVRSCLARLLQPLDDIFSVLDVKTRHCTVYAQALLQQMHKLSTSYWVWSEEEWRDLLTTSFPFFNQDTNQLLHRQLLLIAYVVGPQTDFFLPLLQGMSPFSLACTLFGEEVMDDAIKQIRDALRTWGFEVDTETTRNPIMTTVAEVLLVNRSAHLEEVTFELLTELHEKIMPYKRVSLERLSKALVHLGLLHAPLPSSQEVRRQTTADLETEGIASEWVDWCMRWYQFSGLTPPIKREYLLRLLRAGRWLKIVHPEITGPHQWSSTVAAEYVVKVK